MFGQFVFGRVGLSGVLRLVSGLVAGHFDAESGVGPDSKGNLFGRWLARKRHRRQGHRGDGFDLGHLFGQFLIGSTGFVPTFGLVLGRRVVACGKMGCGGMRGRRLSSNCLGRWRRRRCARNGGRAEIVHIIHIIDVEATQIDFEIGGSHQFFLHGHHGPEGARLLFFFLNGIARDRQALAEIVTGWRGLGDFEIILPHFLQADPVAQNGGLVAAVFGNIGAGQFEAMQDVLPAFGRQTDKIDFFEFVDQRIGDIGRLLLGALPFWHAELKRKLHSPLPRCAGRINSTLATNPHRSDWLYSHCNKIHCPMR